MKLNISSIAAAAFCAAAISSCAFAQNAGGAVGGVVNAGEDIVNGVVGAGEDIINGVTGNETNNAGDNGTTGGTNGTNSTVSGNTGADNNGATGAGTNGTTGTTGTTTANPATGVSTGFAALASVIAAGGVTAATVRRRD